MEKPTLLKVYDAVLKERMAKTTPQQEGLRQAYIYARLNELRRIEWENGLSNASTPYK